MNSIEKLPLILFCLFAFACFTFVFSNYQLIIQFNSFYSFCFILTIILSLICKKTRNCLNTKLGVGVFFCALFLGIFAVVGYGDRSWYSFSNFLKILPFFLVGFAITDFQNLFYKRFLIVILLSNAFLACVNLYNILLRPEILLSRDLLATLYGSDTSKVIGSLIYHYPTQAILALLSLVVAFNNGTKFRIIGFTSFFVLVLNTVFSLWSMPIVFIIVGINIIFLRSIFFKNLKFENRIRLIFALAFFFTLLMLFIYALSSLGGEIKYKTGKIFQVISALFEPNSANILDNTSGGRLTILKKSLNNFIESPFWGKGDYYYLYSGGHCLWFDWLAKYGLFGSIPMMYFVFFLLYTSFSNTFSMNAELTDIVLMGIVFSWFFVSFFNPYLFGTIGYYIFFIAGLVNGRTKCLKWPKMNALHRRHQWEKFDF